jgi:DNA invertase Pin-like site-specific DNA recombinase
MVKPTLPIDIYVRVSRVGKRGEKLISPDEQERRARAHARQHSLRVGKVLPPDLDESGGKLDRPGLNEALERVESGESGGIIVAWLDRLSRDSEHAHGLVRRITEAGGVIYAPDAPTDWTTPEGELQAGFVFLLATYVRKRARAGFERAKEQAIARGIPVNTRAAVGYRKRDAEGEDRRLEPDPATAPIVREVFERRAQGAGPVELAALLERNGVPTSQGSATWSKQAIYNLINNRVYLGELRYGSDDRFVNPDSHQPIVDLALWTAAQHPNGKLQRVGEKSDWLLAGLIRCAACRYCMQGTKTSHGTRIYRCTVRHAGGRCPAPARLNAETVEHAAVDVFWALTADLEAKGSKDIGPDLAGLEATLERAQAALAQYMAPEIQDAIGDPALWAAGLRERRATRDHAAAELGKARADRSGSGEPHRSVETLRGAWERMTTRERRELLGLRFDAIAANREPRSLTIYPAGMGPADLPRRGFKSSPELASFPEAPKGTRAIRLAR